VHRGLSFPVATFPTPAFSTHLEDLPQITKRNCGLFPLCLAAARPVRWPSTCNAPLQTDRQTEGGSGKHLAVALGRMSQQMQRKSVNLMVHNCCNVRHVADVADVADAADVAVAGLVLPGCQH